MKVAEILKRAAVLATDAVESALPPKSPPGPAMGRIQLKAGPHTVDGKTVMVEPTVPGDAFGWLTLPCGRHIIDSRNELIPNPNAGIWVPLGRQ